MKYKSFHPLPSHLSPNFFSKKNNIDYNTLFDKEFIIDKSNTIFTSLFTNEIEESLISIKNYLQKYPDETIDTLTQIGFYSLIFAKLEEGEKSYSGLMLHLLNNIFSIASPEVLANNLSKENILSLINIIKQCIDNCELFCLILNNLTSLLEKIPEISELILSNIFWTELFDFEQQTSFLNEELYLKSIEDDKILFSTARNELKKIEETEFEEVQNIEEEDFDIGNIEEEEAEEEEEKDQKKIKEELEEIMQENRYIEYLYNKNKIQQIKEKRIKIRKRILGKRRLLQILEKEEICKNRIIFFQFLTKLIKSDFNLAQNSVSFDALFNLLDSNFFQRQIKDILISILQLFEFISENDFDLFLNKFEQYNLKERFLKINLIDDRKINQYGLLILERIINQSFSRLKYFQLEEILNHFQNSLVLNTSISQSEKNAVLLLGIIQKYNAITDYYQILDTSGTLFQISTLMKESKYSVSSEAFKTFFTVIQSTSNKEFIDLLSKSPVIETCIGFMDSENQDSLFFSLNIILRSIQIINIEDDLDYIFDSFEQKCDFEDFIFLAESENENIAELASLINNEIMKWQQNHMDE